jgi:enoyl-CoA hydratase
MSEETQATAEPLVTYEQRGGVAIISMNRPGVRNAQNADMTFQLDNAFLRAVNDDSVGAIILAGAGDHFSAGHDIGTPLRDIHRNFERRATTFWPHEDKAGAEAIFVREAELYVGMCRRWRELPKPTIAMVQGACIAGGLMLAWVCDLIVASDDAFFADPVLKMGIPGVEYFAHPFVMNPRIAKEFLYLGERMSAARAYEAGMVNRVIPRAELLERTLEIANKLAAQPRFGIALAKRAINQAEDRMGLRDSIDAVYGLHHVAHAHNSLTSPDHLAGQDARSMAAAQRGK